MYSKAGESLSAELLVDFWVNPEETPRPYTGVCEKNLCARRSKHKPGRPASLNQPA